jgi:hypothetical protein
MGIKAILKSFLPHGLIELRRRYLAKIERRQGENRRRRIEENRGAVARAIAVIRALSPEQCSNVRFLEKEFVPFLGLNDELLHEQPPELSPHFGQGLHIWQYPNQLARYLAWISKNVDGVRSYLEIGCRWGGMFVLISEWLRKNGAKLETVAAIDPIAMSPLITEYFGFLEGDRSSSNLKCIYVQDFSTSEKAKSMIDNLRPEFSFVDGDHTLNGAMFDHMLVRDYAKIIVHHDIASSACPDVVFLWNSLKKLERNFDFIEFVDQYASVEGSYLGIGAMKRRAN